MVEGGIDHKDSIKIYPTCRTIVKSAIPDDNGGIAGGLNIFFSSEN